MAFRVLYTIPNRHYVLIRLLFIVLLVNISAESHRQCELYRTDNMCETPVQLYYAYTLCRTCVHTEVRDTHDLSHLGRTRLYKRLARLLRAQRTSDAVYRHICRNFYTCGPHCQFSKNNGGMSCRVSPTVAANETGQSNTIVHTLEQLTH